MNRWGDKVNFEGHPAIAYATDLEDLNQIIRETVERNFVVFENGTITVTKQGKEWVDAKESGDTGKVRDEIFISHRTTDSTIADMIKDFLVNTGIAWYLDDVIAIPIGLPEINYTNMHGFLGSDYKLRRLNDDGDIAYFFGQAHERLRTNNVSHSVITQEARKLKERYAKYTGVQPLAGSER